MDSVRETMDRIHGLFEKHEAKYARGPVMPLQTGRQDRLIRVYTAEEKAAAVALLKKGNRPSVVAAELGFSLSSVIKWSNHAGLRWAPSGGRPRHPHYEQGMQMLRAGHSTTEVAAKLRISVTTVSNWRIQLGLTAGQANKEAVA